MKEKRECKICGRIPDIVDMIKCPFCQPSKTLEEIGLVDIGIKDGCGQPVLMEKVRIPVELKQIKEMPHSKDQVVLTVKDEDIKEFREKFPYATYGLKYPIKEFTKEIEQFILEKVKEAEDKGYAEGVRLTEKKHQEARRELTEYVKQHFSEEMCKDNLTVKNLLNLLEK